MINNKQKEQKEMSKNVLITGSSNGIGLAIVKKFLVEGYNVYCCDIVDMQLEARSVFFHHCDISSNVQVKNLYNHFVNEQIKFDAIVNNAGINLHASIENITYEEWDRVIKTNVYGAFNVTQYMYKLLNTPNASIVNIGSDQSHIAKKNRVAYCTSKGAILQFTRSLAVDLAYKGIRVNCVCPGVVDTPMMKELTKGRDFQLTQPISRPGKPEEVAEVVYFLCSEAAAYITGSSVNVDGGFTSM